MIALWRATRCLGSPDLRCCRAFLCEGALAAASLGLIWRS
jgi:hypothetical protein